MSRAIVAIVGRPNVGKSTFFNRLTQKKSAIVHETSGVTRDRHYGIVDWVGKEFSLIDTGGYINDSEDEFETEIQRQVELAIQEANVILFMVDVTTGITDLDESVVQLVRKSGKKAILVVNKVDTNSRRDDVYEFYKLGLEHVFAISAVNGGGTGELLDEVCKDLPAVEEEEEDGIPRFAIIGRPNVGKSSLLNMLTQSERSIVTSIAGTTRDSIHTHFNAFGFDIRFTDTAGLRKKSKVHENLEFYSVLRTVRSIENSDVCLLLLDAKDGITSQDVNIFRLAQRNHKGIVILVNKWDLVEKDHKTAENLEERIKDAIKPFVDVPLVFISVKEKQRVHKALEMAMEVYKNRTKKIQTSKLNEILLPIVQETPPPATKGKYIKIKYITQLPTYYPSFAFFCNLPQYIKDPYKRFCENKIREIFDFTGVPFEVYFRKK
ncbi:MAG: ribosome biogenesis GTPase Der [Flavobacteriales bacterium]|nr:ribosome biogenesis GTPase Der [Flavobacteriales bacterium]